MRIVLETLRFMVTFFIVATMIGGISHLILSKFGIHAAKYEWAVMIAVAILTFILFRIKGWGKVFSKKLVWLSGIVIILISLLIPDGSPIHLHTTKYAYSYGFPFQFLILYSESGSKFLISNLFSSDVTGWRVSTGMFANFIIFYFILHFIFNKLTTKT